MKKLLIRIWKKLHRVAWCMVRKGYLFFLSLSGQLPTPQPEQPVSSEKVIYLTFDDGPSLHTERLLGILKRFNVKATFFVVSTSPLFSIVKKAAADGHTIGNHTANHVYKELYKDERSFFDALNLAEKKILEQTGIKTTFLRFPGGSSSIRYHAKNKGFDHTLVRLVQERGYQYVDWNVSARDAETAKTPIKVFQNVVCGVREKSTSIVLLHDIKPYTVDAVEMILIWGLRNGYTFLPLNETSPVVHHALKEMPTK